MSILRAAHREISKAAQGARRFTSSAQVCIPCSRSTRPPHPSSNVKSHGPARWLQASTGYGSGLPQSVRLVEVGPRDGLQNEPAQVSWHLRAMHAVTSGPYAMQLKPRQAFQITVLSCRPGGCERQW